MKISVVNQSKIADSIVQEVLRAVSQQLLLDFRQSWDVVAECELVGRRSSRITRKEVRGDAIIYLRKGDGAKEGALGWHEVDEFALPWGVVYTETLENWTVTLSHEVLEMVLDPHCNRFALGPHPNEPSRYVFHWYEACDAVQSRNYEIAGIEVSDFVLPAYFTPDEEAGQRTSFLGLELPSFEFCDDGYVGFYDPKLGEHTVCWRTEQGHQAAERAMKKRGGNYAARLLTGGLK